MNILQAEIRCKKRELTRHVRHHARLSVALKNGVSCIVQIIFGRGTLSLVILRHSEPPTPTQARPRRTKIDGSRSLRDLKKEEFISEEEYSLARSVSAIPARHYGLSKLHRKDTPLRPVVSATKTVGYGLGRVLTQRLKHLRQSPCVVRDRFDFIEKIKKLANADMHN